MVKKNITIEVVYGLPARQLLLSIEVPVNTTALQAFELSNIKEHFRELQNDLPKMGVFSHAIDDPETYQLHAGDRLELYRPLLADPKEIRRRRAREIAAKKASAKS